MSNEIKIKDYISTEREHFESEDQYSHFIHELPIYDVTAAKNRLDILKEHLHNIEEEINEKGGTDIPEDLIRLYDEFKNLFKYLITYEQAIVEKGRW